ncbi:S8 family serine peptidase [Aeromicrobium chenweiae]|uniref:Type VII secretion-associated serine protease mycosin n=1 Tax=Aeromicrobium chenweiae TaxID=2079793 RepID=A0A2S0WQH7_9ACTN|nr:S8 family serine peptidase [Aeromicrobium chenweiae]AWB93615.1 type VII secretion-associated serine protease mycosin [Aeromicrobium chenweiae]TGN33264.1 type VII secretion-associated serine protease mycosin [Aeromicrobium chenweiae]
MRRVLPAALLVLAGSVTLPAVAATPATADAADGKCTVGKTSWISDAAANANLAETGFADAWRFATGQGVTVAVVDSGVNAKNPHFDGVMVGQKSFVGGSGLEDQQGHGTAVAGIIRARRLPQKSVLIGAAPNASLLSVRVNVLNNEVKTANVAKGIRWAAEQKGVDVINVSISTGPSDPQLEALRSAVAFAVSRDIVVVAAAGNKPSGIDGPYTQVQYPAGFPGVLGVAAAGPGGGVDNWSIHGRHVDVSAPGANVPTTYHGNGDCLVGLDHPYTSYSTPYVSALAALLRERFPRDSAAQIINRITSTADRPRLTERDDREGWGRIQPIAALTGTSSAPPTKRTSAVPVTTDAGITPGAAETDPMEGPRTRLLWWALGATALLSVGLVARPLSARRRRQDGPRRF